MGRKANYKEKPKSGPGPKAKKQQAPELDSFITKGDSDEKTLSRRQRTRSKKRAMKVQQKAERALKKRKLDTEDSDDSGCDLPDEDVAKESKQNSLFPSDSEDDNPDDDFGTKQSKLDPFGSDGEEKDEFSGGENSEDDGNDIEKQSRKLDEEKRRMEIENEEELRSQKVQVEIPSLEDVQKELQEAPDMPAISIRIKDIAFILTDFKARCESGRFRREYLEILKHDLCAYYSYNNFLIEKLLDIFNLTELLEFLESNEAPRPLTIRTNTLKTRRKQLAQTLISQGVNLDTIPWSKVGMVIYSSGTVALGATTEYLAGHYMLQGASSFLPVVSLSPKENERVLDMCAAPGGKSTHIAAMMRNTGILFSNDFNKERTKALIGNFHRMGINNAVITSVDGRRLPKMLSFGFDRCLLDAPCSGTGVISKDEQVKMSKDEPMILRCSHLQRELLLAAIDCVDANSKTGGYICYSTCSILLEENEDVIQYALGKRNVKIVSTGLDVGKPGFTSFKAKKYDKDMALCKRIYPHTTNMDGFFICKIKKVSNKIPEVVKAVGEGTVDKKKISKQNVKNSPGKEQKEENNGKESKFKRNKSGMLGRKKKNKVKLSDDTKDVETTEIKRDRNTGPVHKKDRNKGKPTAEKNKNQSSDYESDNNENKKTKKKQKLKFNANTLKNKNNTKITKTSKRFKKNKEDTANSKAKNNEDNADTKGKKGKKTNKDNTVVKTKKVLKAKKKIKTNTNVFDGQDVISQIMEEHDDKASTKKKSKKQQEKN